MSKLETDAIEPSTGTTLSIGAAGDTVNLSNATVNLPAAAVTTHVTALDNAIRNDIATLALHSAIADNKAAHNLSNSFIDQFEDDTGIHVETTCDRNASEYVASIYDAVAPADVGGTLTGVGDANTFYSGGGANDTYGTGNDPGSGSYNYTWFTSSKLLTGLCMWEIHGGNTNQATNTGAADTNKWEWGVTSQTGQSADHQGGGGVQCNNNLTDCGSATHSNTAPHLWASSGGNGRDISLRNSTGSAGSTNIIASLTHGTIGWGAGESARFVRKDSTLYFQVDGVTYHTFASSDFNYSGDMNGMLAMGLSSGNLVDVNYRSGMTAAKGLTTPTASATGNFTSTTQASTASVSSMGIVVLYKNESGTASLNNDIVAEVSANGGANYSNATLVAGGTFSTGINIAAVSGVAVTAGTTPKYRISFANQASGSKETQVHGVALLY
tara:strand:- start:819 stop:2141 length:1323 start_codon:yes stop_codon:yes gene_type:complete